MVARRFRRGRSSKADLEADPNVAPQTARRDREFGEILTLAHYLVGTRAPDTDEGREACLRRAAEIVLEKRKTCRGSSQPIGTPFCARAESDSRACEKRGRRPIIA